MPIVGRAPRPTILVAGKPRPLGSGIFKIEAYENQRKRAKL